MNQYYLTDQGKVREHNEDIGGVFYNKDNQQLSVVADGMGGHKAGDVASQMVIDYLSEKWKESTFLMTKEETEKWLSHSIQEVNQQVYRYAQENVDYAGMGTTVVAVLFAADFISVAHIGDSRCYLYHNQALRQVTEDHSLVNELVRTGQLSKEDAEYHPRKNVLLKALGTDEEIIPDVNTEEWYLSDRLLICSDGLSNKVTDKELEDFLEKDITLEEISQQLVDLANERGGEDNITVVLSEHDESVEGDLS
ncbi:serine/threonine phosphatase stp [Paraliobacillus quinghaiensis]|uniref:protein-serine/threonine phosphatase n=1 Tax=Paraliobacillus quinghaiensis TaxID=470815 RepID=A0A917TFH3_9BACI|nr:Stp1/IreP family PP2C-type Ser/Thr phosphatase [Paraliobacillus quinghaiensis]GGM21016.1 serine/threonine phosphatase stp [Paraliobacillus quinghaiensis]